MVRGFRAGGVRNALAFLEAGCPQRPQAQTHSLLLLWVFRYGFFLFNQAHPDRERVRDAGLTHETQSVFGDACEWDRRSASFRRWPKLALDVDHLDVSQVAGKCRISAA